MRYGATRLATLSLCLMRCIGSVYLLSSPIEVLSDYPLDDSGNVPDSSKFPHTGR